MSDAQALEAVLTGLGLAGLMLFGAPGRAYVGLRKGLALEDVSLSVPNGSIVDAVLTMLQLLFKSVSKNAVGGESGPQIIGKTTSSRACCGTVGVRPAD